MTPLRRRITAVTAPLLLAVSLTACGGGGGGAGDADAAGSPEDASVEEFCDVSDEQPDESGDLDEQVEEAHDIAEELAEVGTPADADEQVRAGFEGWVTFLNDVTTDDAEQLEADDPAAEDIFEDPEAVGAYFAYVATTCA